MIDVHRRWMDQAACGGSDLGIFFPESIVPGGRETPKKHEWDKAKRICYRCPVMESCRRDTLGEIYGVWGGLDPEQRLEMRRKISRRVRDFSPEKKREVGKFIAALRRKKVATVDILRMVGLTHSAMEHVESWYTHDQANPNTVYLPGCAPKKAGIPVSDEERRRILNLARQGILTYRQIAETVGRTPNTVRSIIHRSKEKSAQGVEEVSPGESPDQRGDHPSQLLSAG